MFILIELGQCSIDGCDQIFVVSHGKWWYSCMFKEGVSENRRVIGRGNGAEARNTQKVIKETERKHGGKHPY